mgnify:FL=1
MNLNEQLNQAYEAGRRQGLNEQGIGRRLMDIGFPTGGGGKPPRFRPGSLRPNPGDLPDRGAIRGYIYALDNNIPPSLWWLDELGGPGDPGIWAKFVEKWRKLFLELLELEEIIDSGDIQTLWALFMRALYNSDNTQVWGDFMGHPIFDFLQREGWNWNMTEAGNFQFIYTGSDAFDPNNPVQAFGMRLAELFNAFDFPTNP